MKDPKKVKRGKKSKAQGGMFELHTRKDLEEKGWIVDRWSNNVELVHSVNEERKDIRIESGKLIPAKVTWRRTPMGMFPMNLNSGFPDFIAYTFDVIKINIDDPTKKEIIKGELATVIGVESKMAGTLDKEEKEKCRWYLDNNIFSKILIARKTKVKNRVVVEYEDFIEIEKRMKGEMKGEMMKNG